MVEVAEQLGFYFAPLVQPEDAGETPEERFQAFHALNPQVYAELRKRALSYLRAGRRRESMKFLFEQLRRDSGLQTTGDPWKLDNTYTPFYARLLMDQEPELAGFFELRGRHGEVER